MDQQDCLQKGFSNLIGQETTLDLFLGYPDPLHVHLENCYLPSSFLD